MENLDKIVDEILKKYSNVKNTQKEYVGFLKEVINDLSKEELEELIQKLPEKVANQVRAIAQRRLRD